MNRRRSWRIGALVTAVVLAAGGGWWLTQERRWQGELFCIERPGTLWNGAAPLPTGFSPECPTYSRSYRQEVRQGFSRIEQYRLPGWQPKALLPPLLEAGYEQRSEDAFSDNYSAFLSNGKELVQYVAMREGETTLIALSGAP